LKALFVPHKHQSTLINIQLQTHIINMADSQYKPTGKGDHHLFTSHETDWQTEHGGLKQDGTPDKRVGTGGMSTRFFKVRNHDR
jgi:hypothetical protein